MLTAQELRIWNWVIGSHADYPSKVGYHKVEGFDIYGQRFNHFDPIPLTHEILEKAGFYKSSLGNLTLIKLPLEAEIKTDGVTFFAPCYRCDGGTDIAKIKYVHQLQNLYFALIGEELTINL